VRNPRTAALPEWGRRASRPIAISLSELRTAQDIARAAGGAHAQRVAKAIDDAIRAVQGAQAALYGGEKA
jgi:hypothetical protein